MTKSAERCSLERVSVREALAAQMGTLTALAGPLRKEDADAVHDARVASRRLRAVLSEHKRTFDKEGLTAARELVRGITSGLGTARELDVSLGELEKISSKLNGGAEKAAHYLEQFLKKRRAAESAKVAEAADKIESPEFQQAVRGLIPKVENRCCYFEVARRRAARRLDAVVDAAGVWKESGEPDRLHALRISFKKLRYACEIYKPLYGTPMQDFIDCLKDAQDCLGRWHDYSMLCRYVDEARAKSRGKRAADYAELAAVLRDQADSLLDMFKRHADVFFYPEQVVKFRSFLSGKIDNLQQEGKVCTCGEHG